MVGDEIFVRIVRLMRISMLSPKYQTETVTVVNSQATTKSEYNYLSRIRDSW